MTDYPLFREVFARLWAMVTDAPVEHAATVALPTNFDSEVNTDAIDWPRVEKALANMSVEDRNGLGDGDRDEILERFWKANNHEGLYADQALDAAFWKIPEYKL